MSDQTEPLTVAPVGCGARIAHLDSGRVFPLTYNVHEVVEGYATLRKVATSRDHVVPGRSVLLATYPAAKPGLEGWVAWIEVKPKV